MIKLPRHGGAVEHLCVGCLFEVTGYRGQPERRTFQLFLLVPHREPKNPVTERPGTTRPVPADAVRKQVGPEESTSSKSKQFYSRRIPHRVTVTGVVYA